MEVEGEDPIPVAVAIIKIGANLPPQNPNQFSAELDRQNPGPSPTLNGQSLPKRTLLALSDGG